MATGQTTYSDITSLINDIYEGAVFTLSQQNLLVPTVTNFNSMGMAPRKVTTYGTANPREIPEGDDMTPTEFSRTLTTTLTPASFGDQFVLTDQRISTDSQNVRSDAAMEMGMRFANYVDEQVATNFSSLTGGTVGAAGSALTWARIFNARAILQAAKVPGPYYCALHPYGWLDLVQSTLTAGNTIMDAPQFRDRIANAYFISTIAGGITFVVTPSIAVDGDADAIGAMYSPMALAYDQRKGFGIEPERDASRRAWELNASIDFAHGVYLAPRGVQIVHDATAPTGA